MKTEKLMQIARSFDIEAQPVKTTLVDVGHINKTYIVDYDNDEKYILQYVNTNVFPNLNELMSNAQRVTNYIEKKAHIKTIEFIKLKESDEYIYNNNWRMQKFIKNTKTYLATESLEKLYEAGKAVGNFQKEVEGFNAETLYEVIPMFHYTPNRVKQLKEAIESKENREKRPERLKKAKKEIEFLTDEKRISRTNQIVQSLATGKIPLRVTHNDTKLSNILFDNQTDKSVCLIDFDTIMPGSIVYDFGEGIRSGGSTSKEDEQDISKIHFDMKRYEAFTKGFMETAKDVITKEEIELLPLGVWMMTYENVIRFLADYLNGDIYFSVKPEIEDHNLIRVRAQSEILKQIEQNEEKMKGMIKRWITKN